MATWEDGPEYAPLERPADFSLPDVPMPLPAADPISGEPRSATPTPQERPAFESPTAPLIPLGDLAPVAADERDPALPFDVVSSTLTSTDSAWGAAHWSPSAVPGVGSPPSALGLAGPVGAPPAPPPTAGQWDPPGNVPWPPTTIPGVPGPSAYPSGFPAPGTPQWFGPGPVQVQRSPAVVEHDARAVLEATTPGLCICLGVGSFIYLLAPAMLTVAFFLSTRVHAAQQQVRRAAGFALWALAFFAVVGFLWYGTADSAWWAFLGRWGQVICWVLLVTVLVQVRRALKRRSADSLPPRPPSTWG